MVSRLRLAQDDGLLTFAEPAAFVNAPGDVDLADLHGRDSNGNILDHARLAARGIDVTPVQECEAAASVVHCHHSKPATFDMLARAFDLTTKGGIVAVDGAKTDGIESIAKALKKRFAGVETYSKAHGKLVWVSRPDTLPDLSDWRAEPQQVDGFWTSAGVFSADGIDKGSALLTTHLPQLRGRGVDLGAGWGYLSHAVLQSGDVAALDLVEADFAACEMARRNIDDPRAKVHWADVMSHQGSYDFVVSNPPFHMTRRADPTIGQGFISKAALLLQPKGSFWLVANQNLPYEAVLAESFQLVEKQAVEGGFKVISASRPRISRARV